MKAVFSIGLILCWSHFLNGQSEFLDYRYSWTETYSCFPPYVETSQFTLDSISVKIDGRPFFEVLRSPTITGDNFEGTGNYVSGLDSNKVYSFYENEVKLLFDYTLQEGDTFYTHNNYDCILIVADIDTVVLLNGEETRKWIFYYSGEDYHPEWEDGFPYWIEGIGNQWGLFGNEQFCIVDGCSSGLLFVHFENELLFNAWPANDTCWYVTATSEISNDQFSIYPNPAFNELSIDANDHLIQKVNIIDLMGNSFFIGNESTVDLSFFPAGYYFLRIELENKQVVMKPFVKL